ncbi:MAG TPA: glycosyltransferase family 2 protein [Steroidobacteraceae bacterium]|jgi:glycosyltransferase involved in cell wall biosynthesis|nr:glycosyltransferase family 2 protein [Steroidobacteraceae bacterium]
MADDVVVIILTFNSVGVIERTIAAARQVSGAILCVDSDSTDGTIEALQRLNCEVRTRPFKHYADQRNWAIEALGNRYAWQLHLDADEVLDAEAITAINGALREPREFRGFLLRRRTYFLGRALRYGGTSSWHMRLFKSGSGACEDRLYDQHFICSGATAKLGGWMHDLNASSLGEWTTRHTRWSELEVRELLRPAHSVGRLEGRLGGDPRERRRAYKGAYYKVPRYLRAWLLFGFRYVAQLGFLDGRAGFLYAFFQVLWFRMLVDAKLAEALAAEEADARAGATPERPFAVANGSHNAPADEVEL